MTTIKLKDRHSGGHVWLTVRDGVVVGAMGSDPKRYLGAPIDLAKHIARYGGTGRKSSGKAAADADEDFARRVSEKAAGERAVRHSDRFGKVRHGGRGDV